MRIKATLGLLLLAAGCSDQGSSAPAASDKNTAGKPASASVPAKPTPDAEKVLRLALERWKQGKDINPEETGALEGVNFVRPVPATGTQRIVSYTVGKSTEKTGDEMTKGMTDSQKIVSRHDFDVTYTPFDPSTRKEYHVKAVFAVMELNDPKSKWGVSLISADSEKPK